MEIYLFWALAAVLVIVGLIGTLVPALPGVPLVFAGLLIAAWIGHFERIGLGTLSLLGLLCGLAVAVDVLATLFGAKRAGASKAALWGAALGSLLGLFSGLVGLLVFPFVGAVAGELIARRQLPQAARVGVATWIGLLLGTVAKLALAVSMIGVFIVSWWINAP